MLSHGLKKDRIKTHEALTCTEMHALVQLLFVTRYFPRMSVVRHIEFCMTGNLNHLREIARQGTPPMGFTDLSFHHYRVTGLVRGSIACYPSDQVPRSKHQASVTRIFYGKELDSVAQHALSTTDDEAPTKVYDSLIHLDETLGEQWRDIHDNEDSTHDALEGNVWLTT